MNLSERIVQTMQCDSDTAARTVKSVHEDTRNVQIRPYPLPPFSPFACFFVRFFEVMMS